MTLATIRSRASQGIAAPSVTIEVHISKGLPGFSIVGLPETAVKESRDRVRSALLNSAFDFPISRLIVNLAPADLPKEGGRFDLPIALGILAASGQIPQAILDGYEFAGELALTGELRPIKGVLPMALALQKIKKKLIIPFDNGKEAVLSGEIEVFAAKHLLEVCAHLRGLQPLTPFPPCFSEEVFYSSVLDLKEVVGQAYGKRALEIAAAGGHSLLMTGPPGTGKTMLASRLPGILPLMTREEAMEAAAIYSISRQGFEFKNWKMRPFRAPHHTASSAALVGGGNPPSPGEVSLAHGGVLFLDELPEFNRHVLEVLREPLEAGAVSISRASHQVHYPARFQLIAAMNPCPCGYLGDANAACRCTTGQVQRYRSRLSGPLMDRIDLHIQMLPLPKGSFLREHKPDGDASAVVRKRVIDVRAIQLNRAGRMNAQLTATDIKQHCALSEADHLFLEDAMEKLGLSARAYHRVLKCARTIADLDHQEKITRIHLQEALSYRRCD